VGSIDICKYQETLIVHLDILLPHANLKICFHLQLLRIKKKMANVINHSLASSLKNML